MIIQNSFPFPYFIYNSKIRKAILLECLEQEEIRKVFPYQKVKENIFQKSKNIKSIIRLQYYRKNLNKLIMKFIRRKRVAILAHVLIYKK